MKHSNNIMVFDHGGSFRPVAEVGFRATRTKCSAAAAKVEIVGLFLFRKYMKL